MSVSRLLNIGENSDYLFVQVRWNVLQTSEDSLAPITHVWEDITGLFEKILLHKPTLQGLVTKILAERSIYTKGVYCILPSWHILKCHMS